MKKVKRFAGLFMMLLAATFAKAQDESKVETSISADVVNQYIWRGQDLGGTSFQPTLGIGCGGFSLSAWGSTGLTNPDDTKEFDITASYTIGGLTVGITDYWFNSGLDERNRYFRYNAHSTNHVFEANIGYDFKVLNVQWYTNFAGNDGANKSGKRAYSSYAEVNVPFDFAGADWTATAGCVPYATTFYGADGFAITNLTLKASKEIKVTDSFSVPVFAGITANPCSQKAYLTFGFTLQP